MLGIVSRATHAGNDLTHRQSVTLTALSSVISKKSRSCIRVRARFDSIADPTVLPLPRTRTRRLIDSTLPPLTDRVALAHNRRQGPAIAVVCVCHPVLVKSYLSTASRSSMSSIAILGVVETNQPEIAVAILCHHIRSVDRLTSDELSDGRTPLAAMI